MICHYALTQFITWSFPFYSLFLFVYMKMDCLCKKNYNFALQNITTFSTNALNVTKILDESPEKAFFFFLIALGDAD